jgi:hypothetical protein
MARINVSMPDSLKERMSALDGTVNWSEVAQAAFEREVSARTFKGENMDQVIQRLRASKTEFVENETAQGREDGRDWATRYADYKDLKRVAGLQFYGHEECAYQLDQALGFKPGDGDSFWIDEDTGRISRPSDEYVQGYVEGARDVWDEVKDKL